MTWRLGPDHPWQDGEPTAFARSTPGFELQRPPVTVGGVESAIPCCWCTEPGADCWPDWLGPAHSNCVDEAVEHARVTVPVSLDTYLARLRPPGDDLRVAHERALRYAAKVWPGA